MIRLDLVKTKNFEKSFSTSIFKSEFCSSTFSIVFIQYRTILLILLSKAYDEMKKFYLPAKHKTKAVKKQKKSKHNKKIIIINNSGTLFVIPTLSLSSIIKFKKCISQELPIRLQKKRKNIKKRRKQKPQKPPKNIKNPKRSRNQKLRTQLKNTKNQRNRNTTRKSL